RAVRLELQVDEALRQRIDGTFRLGIRQFAPLPLGTAALRQPDAIGRVPGPFRKIGRDVCSVRLQRNARFQDDRAVIATLDRDVAREPIDLAKGRFVEHCRRTPTHIAPPEIKALCELFLLLTYRPAAALGGSLKLPALQRVRWQSLRPLPLWERACA